jgi:hypothetical protein
MHVLQWVAVEADDVESAASVAQALLEEEMGTGENYASWYDWFVVGGGRWNIEEDESFLDGYETKTNMIIGFEEDPNAFNAKLQELISYRIASYNEYYEEVKKLDIASLFDNYGGVMTYNLDTYPLRKLIEYLDGDWNCDSKFYDLVHLSTNATHILSQIDNGLGNNLYLVPIDFHF